MLNHLSKPRWAAWEILCLKAAFDQNIPLKIISAALKKTLNAVSKKIKTLELRQHTIKPGRLKGKDYTKERPIHDVDAMMEILRRYAPLSAQSSAFLPQKPANHDYKIVYKNAEYSCAQLEDKSLVSLSGINQLYETHISIPPKDLERWALFKGFEPVSQVLQVHGVAYWRQGCTFSTTQVLVYLNGIRLEKKLKPVCLEEEEKGDQVQPHQQAPSQIGSTRACRQISGYKNWQIKEELRP